MQEHERIIVFFRLFIAVRVKTCNGQRNVDNCISETKTKNLIKIQVGRKFCFDVAKRFFNFVDQDYLQNF